MYSNHLFSVPIYSFADSTGKKKTLGHFFVFNSEFDCLIKDLNLQTLLILLSKSRPFTCFQNNLILSCNFQYIFEAETLFRGESVRSMFCCFEFTPEYTFVKSCHYITITFCLSLFKRQEIYSV